MNPINSTNSTDEASLKKIEDDITVAIAHQNVRQSMSRFERAMDLLADKVEGTSQSVHEIADVARKPAELYDNLKIKAKETAKEIGPQIERARALSNRAIREVQSNPRPYLMAAGGLVAGYLLMKLIGAGVRQLSSSRRRQVHYWD